MLHKWPQLKKHHQFLFSLVIISGMIALWRGIWGLLDLYFFPLNLELSFSLSVVLGVVVIGVTHYTINRIV